MSTYANVLTFEDSRRAYIARRDTAMSSQNRGGRRCATQRNSSVRPAMEAYKPEGLAAAGEGFLSAVRGAVSKSKAERKFEKQFGTTQSATQSAGPRAAVYRGEMGASHKRAARMQDSPTQRPAVETRSVKSRQKQPVSHRPWFIVLATMVACTLFACVFLYPTAQTYYQSIRENDRLQAEYQAVVERNEALTDQMASLVTDEGMAAYAHDRYGWIMPNENPVVVQGLVDQTQNGLDNVAANVIPGSVEAPETWYSPVLDVIFGVK